MMAKGALIKVNLTDEQKEVCTAMAKRRGMSASAYMLTMALQRKQGPSHQDILREICVREEVLAALNDLAAEVADKCQSPLQTQRILGQLVRIEERLQTTAPLADDIDDAP